MPADPTNDAGEATGAGPGCVDHVDDHPAAAPVHSEDVFLRNYDPYEAYDVAIAISDGAEEPVFEERYFFRPGQVASVTGELTPGSYEVTVVLDNRRRKAATCQVDETPEHTIHLEIGNGLVSVTEGLY